MTTTTTTIPTDRNPTDLLDWYLDEIDGTLDSMIGEPRLTDAEIREALAGIAERCRSCIATIDAS